WANGSFASLRMTQFSHFWGMPITVNHEHSHHKGHTIRQNAWYFISSCSSLALYRAPFPLKDTNKNLTDLWPFSLGPQVGQVLLLAFREDHAMERIVNSFTPPGVE